MCAFASGVFPLGADFSFSVQVMISLIFGGGAVKRGGTGKLLYLDVIRAGSSLMSPRLTWMNDTGRLLNHARAIFCRKFINMLVFGQETHNNVGFLCRGTLAYTWVAKRPLCAVNCPIFERFPQILPVE